MRSRRDIEALYRAYGHSVLRRATRLLGEGAEAEDVTQDLFASLLKRPEQFSGRSSPLTFLYAMTTNACLTLLRNRRTRSRLLEDAGAARRVATESCEERTLWLRQFLLELPEVLQEVTVYAFVDELTQEEISQVMGCSRRHVVNLMGRVREHAARFEAAHALGKAEVTA